MSDITDAQTIAIYNAKGQAVPSTIAPKTGDSLVQTVVSGTAFQVSTVRAARLYVAITTASALAIAIGPDSSTAIAIQPSEASALGVTTLEVPVGWWVKFTGTAASFVVTAVLS